MTCIWPSFVLVSTFRKLKWRWNVLFPRSSIDLSWAPKVQEFSRSLGTTMFKLSSQTERRTQVGLLKLCSSDHIGGDHHYPWRCQMSRSWWFFLASCFSHSFLDTTWVVERCLFSRKEPYVHICTHSADRSSPSLLPPPRGTIKVPHISSRKALSLTMLVTLFYLGSW